MSLAFSLGYPPPARIQVPPSDIVLTGSRRRTLLLIHGLTGTPNEMRFLAFYFQRMGYNVVCPSLANHGQPLHILKYTTWEELYAPLREEFRRAVQTGDQVFVAGLSMSAMFVLLLAEEFGSQLAGGACLAPTLFFDGWNIPWYHRLLPLAAFTPLKHYFFFKEGPPYGVKNEQIRAMVHRMYSKARLGDIGDVAKYGYAFFPVSLFHQLHRLARRVIPRLERIREPMLLIHPREDETASVRNATLIHDRIGSGTKKLVILSDSYHVITADQEREKVASEMHAFFEAL